MVTTHIFLIDGAWQLSRSVIRSKSIQEICAECDYITLHLPSVEDTKGMICEETFELMKRWCNYFKFL